MVGTALRASSGKPAAAPCSQQEAAFAQSDRVPRRPTINTDYPEGTCPHCQSTDCRHLPGPPLGDAPGKLPRTARRRARALMRTAADEATRMSVKAVGSGAFLLLLHWWQTR